MIHEVLPVSIVFVDLFITGTKTTTTGTVYKQASTPLSTKSFHQVSVTYARTHDPMLPSLQFFPPLLLLSSQSVPALKNQKSSSVVAVGRRTPATGRRFRCLMQIDWRGDRLMAVMHCLAHVSLPAAGVITKLRRSQSSMADQKCRFFSKRTSSDPPPSQTNVVRLKQNADRWRRPLCVCSLNETYGWLWEM